MLAKEAASRKTFHMIVMLDRRSKVKKAKHVFFSVEQAANRTKAGGTL
jgi:hypothetical protein